MDSIDKILKAAEKMIADSNSMQGSLLGVNKEMGAFIHENCGEDGLLFYNESIKKLKEDALKNIPKKDHKQFKEFLKNMGV